MAKKEVKIKEKDFDESDSESEDIKESILDHEPILSSELGSSSDDDELDIGLEEDF